MSAEHWDLDQDNTLGGNNPSPNKISSQQALKEYIDSHGGGSTDVFWCTYGTTQFDEMRTAQNEGKILLCNFSGYTLSATTYSSNLIRFYTFSSANVYYTISATKTSGGTTNWNEGDTTLQAYKLSSTLNSLSTTDTYPNSKIVYNKFQEKQDIISAGPNIQITQDINNNVLLTDYNDCANIGRQTWYCIAYVKGDYVALSYYGWIGQSRDGETWDTNRISELSGRSWKILLYNTTSDKYVAISQDGYTSTASALDVWDVPIQNSELSGRYWYGGIFDGSKYILIDRYGFISTSIDCETWATPTQITTLSSRNDWYNIAYGNGKYVILSLSGYVSTSDDFITWTTPVQYSNLDYYNWYGLNFDGEKFVALSYYGYISTSTDGADWLLRFSHENLNRNGWYGITSRPSDKKIVVLDNSGYTSHSKTTPTISADVPTENTVSGWGFTKNTGTVISVNNTTPINGNVTLSIPEQVQSDWNETDTTSKAYIQNKPTIPTYNFYGTSFYSTNGENIGITRDCNSLVTNGHYYYTANGPSGLGEQSTDGAVFVQAYNDNWVVQIAQDYRTGNLFTRSRNNGTWTVWKAIASKNDIPTNVSQFTNDAGYIGSSSLVQAPVIIQTYSNGTSWYRIWSDGWCEQGGNVFVSGSGASTSTITYLKTFANVDYFVDSNYVSSSDNMYGQCYNLTTTGCTIKIYKGRDHRWYACGYLASGEF